MNSFFLDFLNVSLTSCYIILAVFLVRLIFSKIPKKYICFLWGLAGIRLIFPFSIESALSVIPEKQPLNYSYSGNGYVVTADSGVYTVDNAVNHTFTKANEIAHSYTGGSEIVINILKYLWIAGMAALLLYGIISYIKIRKSVSAAVLLDKNIKQCETVKSPFILGIVKPQIYIPFNISEETKAYVLAHENAHIKRLDHIVKPFAFLVLAVHWFNPLVWLAYILLCRDIEKACDEKVIEEMESEERKSYASALLSCAVNGRKITACPLAFGEVSVKDRVKSVMSYKKPAFWIAVVAVIACAAIAVCFLTNPKEPEHIYDSAGYRLNVTLESDGKIIDSKALVAADNGANGRLSNGTKFEITEVNLQTGEWTVKLSGTPIYSYVLNELKGPTDSIIVVDGVGNGTVQKTADGKESITFEIVREESVDAAISRAVVERKKQYHPDAEFIYEVHEYLDGEILKKDENGNATRVIAYIFSCSGTYRTYEDGIEMESSSSGALALTFDIDSKGNYTLAEYWQSDDGRTLADSIYKKFPLLAARKAINGDFNYLIEELNSKAEEYLGRKMIKSYGYWGSSDEDIGLRNAYIRLGDNGRFQFNYSMLSSYIGIGNYTLDDKKLIMKTDDGMNTYTFDVDGEKLIFNADESSKLPTYKLGDGTEFEPVPDGAVFR